VWVVQFCMVVVDLLPIAVSVSLVVNHLVFCRYVQTAVAVSCELYNSSMSRLVVQFLLFIFIIRSRYLLEKNVYSISESECRNRHIAVLITAVRQHMTLKRCLYSRTWPPCCSYVYTYAHCNYCIA